MATTAAYQPPAVAAGKGEGKGDAGGEVASVHRIRITLTSKNVANLEKGARAVSAAGTGRG